MVSSVCNEELPVSGAEAIPEQGQAATAEQASYEQILKSSAVIGGAQVMNVAIGIGRTKAMAMLLGPAGFGLAGVYNSIVDLTSNIAGMGVTGSGVRQIAEAVGSGETERITITITVLRRSAIVLGVIGSLALLLLARQISLLSFGTANHATAVRWLSAAVFFKLVSGGQGALIQGLRRIADLAKMNVLGALSGAVSGILLVYLFREKGIVPYVVSVAGMSIVISWWYAGKVHIKKPTFRKSQMTEEVAALLKLGFAFMISTMVSLGVAYAVRVAVLRKVGVEGTGFYQSAWTVGGLYVSFILQAMAADFYPRLTGSIHDHSTCNRLVNEQARVGLLLAGPGVIATLTFAPAVIAALYSSKFGASVPILRWICLGATLQVITWPIGFIIVAKGKQTLFIFSEVSWAVVSLVLAWGCLERYGLEGAGIAFFLSYIFHGFLVYPIARHLSGFRWSRENVKTGGVFVAAIAVVFCALRFIPLPIALSVGTVASVLTSLYSVRTLAKTLSMNDVPRPVRRIFVALGIA